MLETYRTISKSSRIELEDKRSRFIASCQPLETEEEAAAFINGIRHSYPDADHHVYAWILGKDQNLQRFTDDGEPQGTAGLPVLEALRHQGIIQAGIVVTRYFGGTLLGTGGLVRSYGRAAAQVLEAAGPVSMRLCDLYRLTAGYADLDRLRRQLNHVGALLEDCHFGIDVELKIAMPFGQGELLAQACAEASGGAALLEPAGLAYRPLPPPDPPGSGQTA